MKRCTIHVDDEVHCRIGGLRPEHIEVLYNKFGVFVDGYRFMPAFQLRRWDGKIHFFDKNGRTFTKLLEEILPYICAWDYEVSIVDNRLPAPVISTVIDENFLGEEFKLRPYQVNAVNTLLREGSGFAVLATGAGKTVVCAALSMVLYQHGLHTLVIVPSSDLVTQTIEEFREKLSSFDITIGEYSGGQKDIDHPIVIATWQALQNVPHYMSFFQAFICDESHGAKAAVIKDLIDVHGKHVSHRYGVTGTFPKGEADQYSLKCSIGQILVEVPASWLIEQGYLSKVEIVPIEMIDKADLPDYASERAYIASCDERIEKIAELIMQSRDELGNTLVLVNSIPQGRTLQGMIPDAVFLSGESARDLRKANYETFADQDGLIVIATMGIASTGISIDRIFCEILVDIGKSFVKCIQAVGRGLRKRGDKNYVIVKDIHTKLKFGKKHFKERLKHYKDAEYPIADVQKVKY